MSTLSNFQPICSSCPRPATRTTGNHQEWVGFSQIPPATVPMTQPEILELGVSNQSAQCNHNIHADPYPMDPIAEYFESTWSHRDTNEGVDGGSKIIVIILVMFNRETNGFCPPTRLVSCIACSANFRYCMILYTP